DPENPLRYRTLAAPVTSRPSMCAAERPSASAVRRRGRRSVMRRQPSHEATKRELVPQDAQPADDANRRARELRMSPFRFPRVDVGDVDLDERQSDAGERVVQRQARVRVRASVHERAVDATAHGVYQLDQLAFAVALRELDLDAQLTRHLSQSPLDVLECFVAVELRLARTEQIEIRAIQDGDSHRRL